MRHDAEDSHAGVTAGWGDLIRSAEAKGWSRTGGNGPFRCPSCAARIANISGHHLDVWEAAIVRYVAGDRGFLGEPGMPTRREFWNAVTHRPAWMARIKASPSYKPKAGPASAEHLASVVGRYAAGEQLRDICTGRDGWPSARQWHDYTAAHPEVRAAAALVMSQRAAERIADARSRKQPAAPRPAGAPRPPRPPRPARPRRPARAQLTAEATALLAAERAARKAEAEASRRRQQEAAAADRQRIAKDRAAELVRRRDADRAQRKADRETARAEAAADLAAIKEEDRRRRKAERQAETPRRQEARAAARPAVQPPRVRAVADTPEERFRARTAPPDANGCQMWRGGKQVRFDWWVKGLSPADAALMLAGRQPAGNGMMTIATCGNPDCVAVDHLAIVAKPARAKGRAKAPAVDPALLAIARAIIADRYIRPGTKGRDLTGPRRGRAELATARQILQYVLNTEYAYTAEAVSKATGRGRSSVAHALQTIEDRRDDPDFDQRLDETCRMIAEGYQAIAENDQ